MATPTLVQASKANSASASSLTLAYASAQIIGDTNIVVVFVFNSVSQFQPANISVTDTSLNAYQFFGSVCNPSDSFNTTLLYASFGIKAAGAGANTVTVTLSAVETFWQFVGTEWSGVASIDALTGTIGNSANPTASILTRFGNEVIVSFARSIGSTPAVTGNLVLLTGGALPATYGCNIAQEPALYPGVYTTAYTATSGQWEILNFSLSPNPAPLNPINSLTTFPALTGLELCANVPPDSSVLVNTAYTAVNNLSNGINAQYSGLSQIPLMQPAWNMYQWALIYYDESLGALGVTYGTASNTGPIIQLPDYMSQIPLGCVLMGSTPVIYQNQIVGMQDPAMFPGRKIVSATSVSTLTINCAGASEVIFGVMTASTTLAITLTNLRIGVFISGRVRNTNGGSSTLTFIASTPSGIVYTIRGKQSNVATSIDFVGTGYAILTTDDIFLNGPTGLSDAGAPNIILAF